MSNPRRIVVTGASRGLGRAMTQGFVAAGHQVYGCSRSEAAVSELNAQFDGEAKFQVVDVADETAVATWAGEVLADGGPPGLLVGNAALMNQPAPLWESPADEFAALVDVNIKGMFHVIRHFVPAMVAAGRGVIVNFSSGWGRSTSPEVAPYCTTKWAVEGLTRALAQELPDGLAAVPLNPGVIDTDMLRQCWGSGAGAYPSAEKWAQRAVPFLLELGPADNGSPLSVPG